MKRFFSIILFLVIHQLAFSQTAKDNYDEALLNYNSGDFNTALNKLELAKNALGGTNPRIASLQALIYYGKEDYINAKIALSTYLKIVPSNESDSEAHKALIQINDIIDERLSQLNLDYNENLDKERMQIANQYVSQVTAETAVSRKSLMQQREGRLYDLYSKSDNTALMKDYATYFGNTKRTQQINEKTKYLELVASGDMEYKRRSYSNAVIFYQDAKKIYQPDSLIKKINDGRDEDSFQKAHNVNTIESLENYKANYPYGLHVNFVDDVLKSNYLRLAREYIKQKEYLKGFKDYQTLIAAYPRSKEAATASTELCDGYYEYAKANEKSKNTGDMAEAVKYFREAQNCKHADISKVRIKRLERKIIRGSYGDETYFAWTADPDNYVGFGVGGLKNEGAGFYFAARTSPSFFESAGSWTTNDASSNQNSTDKNELYTGEVKARALFISMGLSFKVARPFWIYAGPGVALTSQLKKFQAKGSTVSDWVSNSDQESTSFSPEAGVQLLLGPVTIRYGANKCFNDKTYKNIIQTFGFGFTF